ncbi:DUF2141 domain-containing protein [Sphingomonas sp.]|uniref:DUF2141 domain-containing protein n=1 Tax=Sphingomonas sp. TaxID=28214 RepID=UPI002ED8094A
MAISLACLAALPGAAHPPAATATLDLEITQLRSARGVLRICLTADSSQFPDCRGGASAVRRTISAASPRLRFEGLPPGSYAVAVIHDVNGNARLDTMLGVPREGFGFSRNPAIGFGPPRFSSVRFAVGSGAETQQVRMRYLL